MLLWSQLNSKDFLSSLITNLKTREDSDIQSKILYLIEKWANKFSKYSLQLSNFQNVFLLLKKNNVQFPTSIESNYHKYVKPKSFIFNSDDDDYHNQNINKNLNNVNKKETDPENYLRDINLDLNTTSYEKKYKKLVNKLYDWTHDIHEINVLINKNNGGINNDKIAILIKDLSYGVRQLVETIQSGKLKDENLMNISLNVKKDIDMTLRRWTNHKKGIVPNPFISSFLQNDDTHTKNEDMDFNSNNKSENKINNSININNFYNINNSTYMNANKDFNNINNNNINENNNKNSFNLLIDFNFSTISNNQSNNQNFYINDKNNNVNNNMNSLFDFESKTDKQNQFSNITHSINNDFNNNINNSNNSNVNDFNYKNNMNNLKNNLDFSNIFNNNINNNNNFKSNNDDMIRQSLMYPSFEELDQE